MSVAALARFAGGEAKAAERRRIIRHLLAGCGPCRTWLREHVWGPEVHGVEPPGDGYDGAFAAAEAAAREEAGRRRMEVQKLLSEIDGFPPDERELKVRNLRRFGSTALAAALIERSDAARWNDPEAMLADARLAVAAAEAAAGVAGLDEAREMHDCQARAWGQLANALRLRAALLESEDAFAVALHHLDEGTGQAALRGLLYRHLAALRCARRQFQESIELLRRAIAIYRGLGDVGGEAAARISLGIASIYSGDPAAAVEPFTRCLAELDPRRHVDLVRAASLNLVRCYLDLGDPARADAQWAQGEPLFAGCGDQLALLRRAWHRGLIDYELGELAAAEACLQKVRDGFLGHGLLMESALASLHLTAIYVRHGRVSEVVQTIGEIIPIFRSLGWEQELLASLTRLAGVAHDLGTALDLLQRISRAVEQGSWELASAALPHD